MVSLGYALAEDRREASLPTSDYNEKCYVMTAVVDYPRDGDYEKPRESQLYPAPVFLLRVPSLGMTHKVNGLAKLTSENFYHSLGGDFWKSESFADTIAYIYSSQLELLLRDQDLCGQYRQAVVRVATDHLVQLVDPPAEYACFRRELRANPDFAFHLLQRTAQPTADKSRNQTGTFPLDDTA